MGLRPRALEARVELRYKLTILKLQAARQDKEDSVQWAVNCLDWDILQLLPFKRF